MQPGTRLGPYEIVSLLGAGGMGEVYRARDTRLDRSVAVKVLAPELASDADFRARFAREAKAISGLNHAHICGLYDIGQEHDTQYLVLELLEGETLAARLERGQVPPSVFDAFAMHSSPNTVSLAARKSAERATCCMFTPSFLAPWDRGVRAELSVDSH